jgi:hypothetical protein
MTPAMTNYRRLRSRYTYADYEDAKRAWVARNPGATPEQYQLAMMRIAQRMGL